MKPEDLYTTAKPSMPDGMPQDMPIQPPATASQYTEPMPGKFVNPAEVIHLFGLSQGTTFADFGAGTGAYVLAAAPLIGDTGQIYAIDIQKDMLLKLKQSVADAHHDNVKFLWCNFETVEATKLPDNSVDVAVLSNTLFQIENKRGALQEIYRILKYLDDIEKHPLALKTEYYKTIWFEDEHGELHSETVHTGTTRYSFQLRDDFGEERTFGGEREHMGNDLMSNIGTPITSMTAGVITAIGWTELAGYRIGITSKSGAYFFYAHMDDFASGMRKGKRVSPGEVIGFVGDTGYGPERTTGQFAPHLHLQIGIEIDDEMIWMNPYQALIAFENKRVTLTEFD